MDYRSPSTNKKNFASNYLTMKFRLPSLLFAFIIPTLVMGQDAEMADALRANGKIYIVVTILSVILAGIFVFLMSIDFRLRKLEKNGGKSPTSTSSNKHHMKDKV